MKKKNKPTLGRPKMAEGTANTVLFAFKIAANEAEQIEAASARAGMSKAEWARHTLIAASRT